MKASITEELSSVQRFCRLSAIIGVNTVHDGDEVKRKEEKSLKMAGKVGDFVYRINKAGEWEELQKNGSVFGGEFDRSSGFIHLSKLDQNWMSYLGMARKATESLGQDASQKGTITMENNTSNEAKKLAAAALAAVKDDIAAAASGRGKIAAVLKEFQKAQQLAATRETTYTLLISQASLPSSYTASEVDVSSDKAAEQVLFLCNPEGKRCYYWIMRLPSMKL